jgi:hypothetical protein
MSLFGPIPFDFYFLNPLSGSLLTSEFLLSLTADKVTELNNGSFDELL